jgi:3-phenylpropionate/trans-cinnamate dioxygenase ferredoxin reductase subunit
MAEPIVIVGAGQAGAKAAETLRRSGYDGALVLMGVVGVVGYQRPPLSKKFLSGAIDAAQLRLYGPGFANELDLEFVKNERVTAIDRSAKRITSASGRIVPYSKLLLATGTRPRILPLPGADLKGVHVLRSIADVEAMQAELHSPKHVAIIGGGYIGLETAAMLRLMGHDATVIEAQRRLLQRVAGPEISDFFRTLHIKNGVRIRLGAGVKAITGTGHVDGVETSDGRVPAELVLVAAGSVANDELARAAGLETADGIIVDGQCRAGDDVFAAGDCTRFFSPRYGRSIRLESVQNATDQARAAAAAMLGITEVYDPVPWFWSDQYDIKLQIAGLNQGYDRTETTGDPDAGSFSLAYFSGNRLLCVDAINAPRAHMTARRQLASATMRA